MYTREQREIKHYAVREDINEIVKDDWNSPRAKVFIVAKLVEYQERLEELTAQLKFEREVGKRTVEIFKDAITCPT